MSYHVTLQIDSELKPTELAIMVNMFPGVNDCYIAASELVKDKAELPEPEQKS